MTEVHAVVYDNALGEDVVMRVNRTSDVGAGPDIVNESSNLGGGDETLSATGLSEVIDNSAYSYQVFFSWTCVATPDDLGVRHVRIKYTVTKPLP
jgi:hypothetical protein